MNCPNCQTSNPESARFCMNCGHSLRLACPNCGTELPASARFCFNCGQQLGQRISSPPPPQENQPESSAIGSSLERFIPRELLTQLRTARERGGMVGERRIVTMLFCDVKGSSSAAQTLDPEDWSEIINGAFEEMIRPIYRYEGTVARLMGDGILAFFGAPIAHEDDPQRAVLAGLEIVEGIRRYGEQVERRWHFPLAVRIGVNTGLVLVGEVGSDLRMEYTALGDAINLAARMEQTAQPNTVQIAEDTYRLIAPLFEFEDLGFVEVKGRAQPVHVYRPLRRQERPGRLRGLESHGIASPLVGRDRELKALLQALADVCDGRGGIISLVGEAGLGKSRLVAELRAAALEPTSGKDGPSSAESVAVRWCETRCLSYTTSVPHRLSIDLLSALLDLPADAAAGEAATALRRLLASISDSGSADLYPFLGHLLNLDLDDEMAERVKYLDGPALLNRYAATWKSLLAGLAQRQPLILVCDDIHWADPSSVELLLHVLSVAAAAPVLFLLVTRPERDAPGWRLVSQAREVVGAGALELHLAPLSEGDSQQLVSNLLDIDALPAPVRQLILAKSEGNPFFVEEVLRMLIDRGLIARRTGQWMTIGEISDLDIPDNVNGVLAARIDRLPEEARHVLQIASVVGRQFYTRILSTVLQREAAL